MQVGDAVDDLRPGDSVWASLPVRGTRFGTYAEYVAIEATLVGRRPPNLNAAEAASLPLAGSTALQILDRLALKPGQSLLVHGAAGGVGSLLVQLARARGIRVAGSASRRRLQLLHQLGVEWPIDYQQADSEVLAFEQRGGRFDAVADLVGQGLGPRSLPAIRDGGALASIVELRGDFEDAVDRNISLHGVLLEPSRQSLDRLADAVTASELRPLVDAVVPLEDVADAHRRIESGHGQGKVVIAINTDGPGLQSRG